MKNLTNIKVIGIGGSGCNTISRMMKNKIEEVELVALNTDIQDLKKSRASLKLQIGKKITQGLGTGMNPEIGEKAAEEQRKEIEEILKGTEIVFITCGLGGGTGSGAAPVVAEISRNLGILTIVLVTKPFSFEGQARMKIAEAAIKKLKERTDTLIIIQNDKLLELLNPQTSVLSAFWFCDDILRQAVAGISELIILPGLINVDFADIKAIMKNAGSAIIGIGKAKGENRAEKAVAMAIKSPLVDTSIRGAKGILFNISGNRDLKLSEVDEIAKLITQEIHPEAKVIFGALQDEKLKKGEIKITLIATGF